MGDARVELDPMRAGARRLVDLSHVVADGMSTYPGLPEPHVSAHLDREAAEAIYGPGVAFTIGMITMCSNTGTYLDVPFHRFAHGHDLTELSLARVAAVPGVCFDCRGSRAIGPEAVATAAHSLTGHAVLFRTDHSRLFGQPGYFDHHPYLTAEAAEALVAADVACVGIDSLNIDATHSPDGDGRPVHTTLLGHAIPIVEHLRGLDQLPAAGFSFTAVPPKIAGMGSFTVRAFATIG